MSIISNGRIWPIAIGLAITAVFSFCVGTVFVTQTAHIQESDAFMTHYQDADANINKLIEAKIAFDKVYKIDFASEGILETGSVLKYKISDKDANVINNANIVLAISRPETAEFNQKLENPTIENGVYTFSNVKFPKAGVWNIVSKIKIDKLSRFYNVKVDTRHKQAFEF